MACVGSARETPMTSPYFCAIDVTLVNKQIISKFNTSLLSISISIILQVTISIGIVNIG